jgi:hypothetical protein
LIPDENVIMSTILYQSLEVLMWIYQHFGKEVFMKPGMYDYVTEAIRVENIPIVKYLVETVEITEPHRFTVRMFGSITDPTEAAVFHGIELLRYLIDKGFPCSTEVPTLAIYVQNLDILIYCKVIGIELNIAKLRETNIKEGTKRNEKIYEWLNDQIV